MKKPNLFLVGPPKCGTSAMFGYLEQHPDICAAKAKEPYYFATDFIRASDEQHGRKVSFTIRTEEQYLSLYAHAEDERYLAEATPGYIYSREAPKKIHDFNEDAKIITMVRDPVKMVYSWYAENVRQANETAKSLRKALDLEAIRKKGKKIPVTAFSPCALYYSDMASFVDNIKRYQKLFGKNVKVIVYDDFRADNKGVFRDLCSFLDIRDVKISRPQVPRSRNVRFPLLNRAFHLLKLLPNGVKRIIPFRGKLVTGAYSVLLKEEARPPLDDETVDFLKKRFKPEVEKLSKFLDRDLIKEWGY